MVRSAASKLVLFAFASLLIEGCPNNECTYDQKHPESPVEGGLDCPPDQSCYIGQCFRQCNPGVERNEPCTTSDDCKESSRPNCVFLDAIAGSFCSTCEEGQTCVLGLNICQAVAEIPDPMVPSGTMSNVPLTLDGGALDATSFEDAGIEMPIARNVNYAGYVTLMQRTDYTTNGSDNAYGDVSMCNVTDSTVMPEGEVAANGYCQIRTVKIYAGTSTPADLGTISFEPDMGTPMAMTNGVSASFEPIPLRRYIFEEALPPQLLVYSTAPPSNHKYVNFSGGGAAGVASPWASSNGGLLLVPYELFPTIDTRMMMAGTPIMVDMMNPLDLTFSWEVLPDEIRGSDLGISVVVEIGGQRSTCDNTGAPDQQYVIRCQVNEAFLDGDTTITVASDLLYEYIGDIMANPGDRVPVRFGRVRSESMLFFNATETISSQVDLYFGQEFTSELQFFRP